MVYDRAMKNIRNRIVEHRQIRACDLQAHPMNPRTHNDTQRQALRGLLTEIGLARSVLAYVAEKDRPPVGDGRLTLIDGHLRHEELGKEVIEVEVLDVSDSEARALLLSMDPLAALAGFDGEVLHELREITEKDSKAVRDLWAAITEADERAKSEALKGSRSKKDEKEVEEKFLIIVECNDEREQVKLLREMKKNGLRASAKIG